MESMNSDSLIPVLNFYLVGFGSGRGYILAGLLGWLETILDGGLLNCWFATLGLSSTYSSTIFYNFNSSLFYFFGSEEVFGSLISGLFTLAGLGARSSFGYYCLFYWVGFSFSSGESYFSLFPTFSTFFSSVIVVYFFAGFFLLFFLASS